jgi:hypothetical protein
MAKLSSTNDPNASERETTTMCLLDTILSFAYVNDIDCDGYASCDLHDHLMHRKEQPVNELALEKS